MLDDRDDQSTAVKVKIINYQPLNRELSVEGGGKGREPKLTRS